MVENRAPGVDSILRKFDALIQKGDSAITMNPEGSYKVEDEVLYAWWTNAVAFLSSVFGDANVHYRTAHELAKGRSVYGLVQLRGVLKGARDAFESGYVFDMRRIVEAEVESDLIGQAKALCSGGYLRAAAVVCGAVLEEHLRTIAPSWGVVVTNAEGKSLTLEPLNIALKKAGAYDGILQKRITLLGGIRNPAAHGEAFDVPAADVEKMLLDVLDICDRVVRP
jgi:hypothetical protein